MEIVELTIKFPSEGRCILTDKILVRLGDAVRVQSEVIVGLPFKIVACSFAASIR
jgi:hypothetical protein